MKKFHVLLKFESGYMLLDDSPRDMKECFASMQWQARGDQLAPMGIFERIGVNQFRCIEKFRNDGIEVGTIATCYRSPYTVEAWQAFLDSYKA